MTLGDSEGQAWAGALHHVTNVICDSRDVCAGGGHSPCQGGSHQKASADAPLSLGSTW